MATDLYQPKYEHLLMDPAATQVLNAAKMAELKALITLSGETPTSHGFPAGVVLANAGTGNATSSIHASTGRYFTNDLLLRIVTTVGSTPTAKFDIEGSVAGGSYANCNYALIATPNTLVADEITITTATTNVYRIPPQQLDHLKVVVSSNTNVTYTIDVWDFGGVA